ncbi:Ni/Fe-hydrogenase 1 B-type cytochrome subunit [Sporomusaceae bacterium BoRhaA]|uniref:Ni/Fe-hydrogenase, b-type cytochrome subunit n=1 Tax=Pelorhabdus rhamnosifermentans TaxID=2772457 RepID=UPI001C0647BA|nr:Ni/Fe-hydrogenase, b-type cytochrome subunit [Pelorhabdus rhamnosifermentans]MBU2702366.1 Ni/Fe-hydrogenase 1 B-type cytochrome subunit [Pelorhabdus rhamnosifermentans]
MNEGHLKAYYVYSPFLRIFHWIMVISIIILFFTGLYIAKPLTGGNLGIEPTFADPRFSLNAIRNIHFITSYIFVGSFILRIYGYIINKGDRLLPRFWTKSHWQWTIDTALHYLLIQPFHKPYLRNPLARMSYLGLYILVAIEVVTGFAMYFMVDPNGFGAKIFGSINSLFGNEYIVHLVHHYVAWLIIIFAIIHVYMAIRADFMDGEGEISSMFSGVKFLPHVPVDIGEIQENEEEHTSQSKKSITE